MKPTRMIYLPLEPYQERYTSQLSAPKVGWFEANWIKAGINYLRIDGDTREPRKIRTGSVLDAVGRSRWCANQMLRLYDMIERKELSEKDVIYFDDFWHPGVESLRYIFDQMPDRQCPKLYSFCWAQSADIYDFTFPMRKWIRHYEKGNGRVFDQVFVANTLLQELLIQSNIVKHPHKVKVVGLPFDSSQVLSMMGDKPLQKKKRQVVFSSRWTWEKRPDLFVSIIKEYLKQYPQDTDIKFVFCTSADEMIRNNYYTNYKDLPEKIPQVEFKVGLSKQEYYDLLCESAIQINTSLQDWVSYTLLEAICANCQVIYPNERSFPETFSRAANYIGSYPCVNITNPEMVVAHMRLMLDNVQYWGIPTNNDIIWKMKRHMIVDTHDLAWKRILYHMGMLEVPAAERTALLNVYGPISLSTV